MTVAAKPPRRSERPPERAVAVRSEQDALVALDAEIERRRAVLEDSAASLIDPRRLKGVVLSVFTRRPELWECDPVSVARAVVEAAQLGLEPTGAIGGAHLVPFFNSKTGKKEVQLILDYRGVVQLARRSKEVSRVEARVVREKDEFDFAYGLEPTLRHVPALIEDPGPMTFVYAVAIFADGSRQFDVMSAAQIEVVRSRSKAKDNGPWVTDYFEMAKKTVLKRLAKLLPLSIEARAALESEDEQEREPVEARAAGRATVLRSTLRDKVAQRFATVDTTPQVAAGGAEATTTDGSTDVTGEETATDGEAVAICSGRSPYDPPTDCILPADHAGFHRSGGAESWE